MFAKQIWGPDRIPLTLDQMHPILRAGSSLIYFSNFLKLYSWWSKKSIRSEHVHEHQLSISFDPHAL
jgi:hypothetical protein